MLGVFFFVSVVGCVFSYISFDPMKSSFFLVFSLLSIMPIVSLFSHVWFSYFICLLFLSGIFVILVYFSSLSKFMFLNSPLWYVAGGLTLLLSYPVLGFVIDKISLCNFYYDVYCVLLFWLILVLLFFMNFTSYYLSFSGALRKI